MLRAILGRVGLYLLFTGLFIPAATAGCKEMAAPEVDWSGCNKQLLQLDGSDLTGANLEGAFLSGTGLVSARLANANLQRSELVRTSLKQADLSGANLERANLRNAKNFVDLFRQARGNDAPPRLVLNKVGMAKRPEIKVEDFAKALDLQPVATIPFDAQLFGTAANNGQMIAETNAKSPVVGAFDSVARIVTGRAEQKRPKRSGLAPLFSRMRGRKPA